MSKRGKGVVPLRQRATGHQFRVHSGQGGSAVAVPRWRDKAAPWPGNGPSTTAAIAVDRKAQSAKSKYTNPYDELSN